MTEIHEAALLDMKGRPIHAYDLLRQYHFRDRRWGHQYLYHVAMPSEKGLEAVPVSELATGKSEGGRYWLNAENARNSEIIDGCGKYPDNIFQERAIS